MNPEIIASEEYEGVAYELVAREQGQHSVRAFDVEEQRSYQVRFYPTPEAARAAWVEVCAIAAKIAA